MSGRPIRVLHCPHNIAGNPAMLAKAERTLGLESWSVALRQSKYQFGADEILIDENAVRKRAGRARRRLFWRALRDFDVIHYNFGQTILRSQRDLPILKALGKVIAVTFQGDDARQIDWCLENWNPTPAQTEALLGRKGVSDDRNRRAIATFDRYADCIFAVNPDLLPVLPHRAQFLPYASVDPREWRPPTPSNSDLPLVLHAPTNRIGKGTGAVVDAVERLRAEGVPFEFRLLEGYTHDEARKLYAEADLLIDQLVYGWFGALSVELMAMGKPVVCYIRESDARYVPAEMRSKLPIINADQYSIYETLKNVLLRGRGELARLGRQSRAFVERWFDPLVVAETTKAAYEKAFEDRAGHRIARLIRRGT